MWARLKPTLVKYLSAAILWGKLLALFPSIQLVLKCLPRTSILLGTLVNYGHKKFYNTRLSVLLCWVNLVIIRPNVVFLNVVVPTIPHVKEGIVVRGKEKSFIINKLPFKKSFIFHQNSSVSYVSLYFDRFFWISNKMRFLENLWFISSNVNFTKKNTFFLCQRQVFVLVKS